MKSLRDMVEEFLVEAPMFRERIHKDRGIVHLLIKRNGMPEDKKKLVKFVHDYASADRSWRQILEDRKDLRGKDYAEKAQLVEKKRRELGYTP